MRVTADREICMAAGMCRTAGNSRRVAQPVGGALRSVATGTGVHLPIAALGDTSKIHDLR
jgi:hypothetical protein